MDIRHLVLIDPQDIRLGSPTHVDIYGPSGQLFLRRGATVYSANTVERLHETGYKIAQQHLSTKNKQESVFLRIGDIADKLREYEQALLSGQGILSFSHKIRTLAQAVIQCCDEDADAALAQSYLNYHHPYSVLHHILVAVLVSVLAKVRGWSDPDRISLVAAALTHDIGAIPLRDELASTPELSSAQKIILHEHPTNGVYALGELGVTDALWLQAVQDHHEYLDGSGYPRGIHVGVHAASTLMTVADGFAAMMRPRPYRDRRLGNAILEDLHAFAGTRYAPSQIDAIATYFGPYHAGSVVRLACGDMAVVTKHRPDQPTTPELLLIATTGDQPLDRPYAIDSADPEYAIVAALQPEVCLRFRNMVNKSWGG